MMICGNVAHVVTTTAPAVAVTAFGMMRMMRGKADAFPLFFLSTVTV
jgi:hypothetical protein